MNAITVITAITLILSGTIAGYITNKYAVKWLFKPVKVFGKQIFDVSILSTDEKQEAFIESLSACVEEKILTNEVLKKELINDTMKSHIDEIIEYLTTEALPESFKSVSLSDLNGFDDMNASLKSVFQELLDENTDPLLINILDEIKVSEYLTEIQIQSGVDNMYDSIKHALSYNESIKSSLTGLLTEMFFMAMFNPEGRSALGKLISKLFKGNPTADPSDMTLPEKISMTVKGIISGAVSGHVHDKSVNEYMKSSTREALGEKIQKEILEKYDSVFGSISDKSISSASRLLSESDSVKETISNMVFDYISRNINGLLNGKIKETVKMALGRLDPDQLCDVAQRLLKGELKYLSYFGGLIGFLVSIPALFLTLGRFSATGFPQNPLMFLFLMVLMGFIGVITNIIAISMFFHPCKEIRALAKHKHTKVFSRGLILQNQPVFAHTLGEYIGQELLTADNIRKMLSGHEEAFVSQLSANIMPYIKSFFENQANKKAVSAKISAFALNKIQENQDKIVDLLDSILENRTFGSLIDLENPETRAKAVHLYASVLERLAVRPDETESENQEAYDFKFIAYALSSMIRGSSSLMEKTWFILENFYTTEISGKGVADFFSMEELCGSLKGSISAICIRKDSFNDFRNAVNSLIYKLTDESEKNLSPEFVKDISERCAKAVYDSTLECIPSLVDDLHIDTITETRVASLEPEEIKKVVLSFADPVFKKLYALGTIGCVFGLNSYLAFILFIIDKIADSRDSGK